LCGCRSGKPVITYDDRYKSTVALKAGSTLTISVAVSGAPTPRVTWQQDGEAVPGAAVDAADHQSTLTVKNVTRKLTAGKIVVTAENKVGKDSAEFTVDVKGTRHHAHTRTHTRTHARTHARTHTHTPV